MDFSNARYASLKTAFQGKRMPLAFVDLDSFDANLDTACELARAAGKTLRMGTKSLRCLPLMERALRLGAGTVKGFLTYTAEETAWLASRGHDDFLLAYPTVQPCDLDLLANLAAAGKQVAVMVDCEGHLEALDGAGRSRGVRLSACLELDLAFRPLGGDEPHLGLRRSPIRTPEQAMALARAARRFEHVRIDCMMGYEGHIAGTSDDVPGKNLNNLAVRGLKAAAVRDLTIRRQAVVEALSRAGVALRLVNGGGSGSLVTTLRDPSITEGVIGSGLYASSLFHHFKEIQYRPAAFFALQVVRFPKADIVTCAGGGYIASGPADKNKLPLPVMPLGLTYLSLEGAGEVQTPLRLPSDCPPLQLGDPIFFQHAKAGELCERFNHLFLFSNETIVETVPTYRGEGQNFL